MLGDGLFYLSSAQDEQAVCEGGEQSSTLGFQDFGPLPLRVWLVTRRFTPEEERGRCCGLWATQKSALSSRQSGCGTDCSTQEQLRTTHVHGAREVLGFPSCPREASRSHVRRTHEACLPRLSGVGCLVFSKRSWRRGFSRKLVFWSFWELLFADLNLVLRQGV